MNSDTILPMKLRTALNDVYPISDSSIEQLWHCLEPFNVEKGGQIVTQGVVSRSIYIVLEGMLRCYTMVDGIEYTRWFATPGDVVTSMFSYSITCLQPPQYRPLTMPADIQSGWRMPAD